MKKESIDSNLLRVLRQGIDEIDSKILELVAERMEKVSAIGQIKAQSKLPVIQEGRWQELMADRQEQAKTLALSPELTQELFELIAKHAISIQQSIFEKEVDNG